MIKYSSKKLEQLLNQRTKGVAAAAFALCCWRCLMFCFVLFPRGCEIIAAVGVKNYYYLFIHTLFYFIYFLFIYLIN
ncbi:50S Ribosomal protein L22p/L17e [Candidatus Hodgkinia cicadicola]|nr:50S Ribosomal protein L22p/L17e [Candidatus Hodgkinia cicadicola]